MRLKTILTIAVLSFIHLSAFAGQDWILESALTLRGVGGQEAKPFGVRLYADGHAVAFNGVTDKEEALATLDASVVEALQAIIEGQKQRALVEVGGEPCPDKGLKQMALRQAKGNQFLFYQDDYCRISQLPRSYDAAYLKDTLESLEKLKFVKDLARAQQPR